MPCLHLRLRAIRAQPSVTLHHVMNYWCLTILLGVLLSTANGNRPPDNVTQNGITDTSVNIKYDTYTNYHASTSRPVLQNNDIASKPENTATDSPPPSATHFDPTTPIPINACYPEHLTVTSTPVHIIALTRENLEDSSLHIDTNLQSKCSIHVTAPNNTAIMSG